MGPIKLSTCRVQDAISPGIKRLESGANNSLPFHADVKKLVECEHHYTDWWSVNTTPRPIACIKRNFFYLNAIQIVYFDT
jgi:hypothetical protein